ncbi:MAG: Membrane-bound lytic murein transglycosylase F [Desulfovibrio sp.]
MQKPFRPRRQFWLCSLFVLAAGILLLVFVPAFYAHKDGDSPRAQGPVRIGAPEPVRQATVISPYGPGFEFELISQFCREAFHRPEWVNVSDKDAGLAMLQKGEIDVLVGFWGDLPETADGIAAGNAYAHFNPVRISGAVPPRAEPMEAGDAPASAIDALARTFSALMPAFLSRDEENAEAPPFPVFSLEENNAGASADDIMLLDPASYALWLPFMGDVSTRRIRVQTPYRWFWRADGSPLAGELETFWKNSKRKEEVAELTERYFGFLPRTLRQQDILELAGTLAARLPAYEEFIKKAAKETGVPPLLLVAVIYQESRFDPDAVSETQVRGIMQLTTATAKMLEVDRKNPEECIMGGARYLRDLRDKVGDKATNDWDRWFMALAAYNQGMSNLNRTIRLSKELGGKGNTWADLKRAFPLSTTCRGIEAKSFVEKIRYYHFILHGLVALAPAETQHLAPLLGLATGDGEF